jgi:hypothetical protein
LALLLCHMAEPSASGHICSGPREIRWLQGAGEDEIVGRGCSAPAVSVLGPTYSFGGRHALWPGRTAPGCPLLEVQRQLRWRPVTGRIFSQSTRCRHSGRRKARQEFRETGHRQIAACSRRLYRSWTARLAQDVNAKATTPAPRRKAAYSDRLAATRSVLPRDERRVRVPL